MNEKFGATLFSQGKPSQVISLAKDKDRQNERFGAKPLAQKDLAREVRAQIDAWHAQAMHASATGDKEKRDDLWRACAMMRDLYSEILYPAR